MSWIIDHLWLIPAVPFAASLVILSLSKLRRKSAVVLAITGQVVALAMSVLAFLLTLQTQGFRVIQNFTWFTFGEQTLRLGFVLDPLAVAMLVMISLVGLCIFVFSVGYMAEDKNFTRFFAYMSFFSGALLGLVSANSLLLLIGFWLERPSAAGASKKAFITTRIGDMGFFLGMLWLYNRSGTLLFYDGGRGCLESAGLALLGASATFIALLIFFGAVGKSGQFPLHVWLPDAMEGPTPVSALIHAATMVTAGIFLVARAHPFFEASGGSALTVVSIIGAATALLAATVALIQVDVKRVLAYSTISQLGYMFLALGVRAYAAAIFLVVAHAFYKATLFLGAGSVIHGGADNQDMRTMGGLRKYMPYTALGFIIAWLAIAGVPPFAGFWAKDEVLSRAYFAGDYGVWIIGVVAAAMTAFYMTREVWLVFFGNERFLAASAAGDGAEAPADTPEEGGRSLESPTVPAYVPPRPATLSHPPHESPPTMTLPILTLAGLAAVGGLLSLPFGGIEFLSDWLHPTFARVPEIDVTSFVAAAILSVISVLVALVGLAMALSVYRDGIPTPEGDPLPERLGVAGRLFQHAYYLDESIAALVRGPVYRFADWLNRGFDLGIIDGAVNGVATVVRESGGRLRRVQTGLVRNYALGVVLGAVALLIFLAVRAG